MAPHPTRTILLIDDDAAIRGLLRLILEDASLDLRYRVLDAGDGSEALRILTGCTPHLIVLDLEMPGMSGRTLVLELRASRHWQKIPILLYSASAELALEAEALGVAGHLQKPSSRKAFLAAVEETAAHS